MGDKSIGTTLRSANSFRLASVRRRTPQRKMVGEFGPRLSLTQPDQCRKLGSSPEKPSRQKAFSIMDSWAKFTKGANRRG